jgi:hypothetical protein
MQRNTAAIEPRCLKAERRKLPTPADADADVQLAGVVQLFQLLRRQQLGQQLARLAGGQHLVRQLQDLAVDLDEDRRVGRHVDVRRVLLRHQPQHAFHVAAHALSQCVEGVGPPGSGAQQVVDAGLGARLRVDRFTITAQYRLYLPSALGRLPLTTTLPAGMRP